MASSKKVKPVPDGYHTATPYLCVRGGTKAIDYYVKAFGAKEIHRMADPDGKLMHAEIQIGDSRVFLGDECREMGALAPESLGGSPVGIFLYVPNVDAAFKRAVDAGATPLQPPADMFWGDRYGKLRDPFGHLWSLGTHIEDVPPEEMSKRAASAMAKSG